MRHGLLVLDRARCLLPTLRQTKPTGICLIDLTEPADAVEVPARGRSRNHLAA